MPKRPVGMPVALLAVASGGTKAILNGSGSDYGELEYLPKNIIVDAGQVVYTSGSDLIILPGIPIGKVDIIDGHTQVKFFSDFTQLNFIKIRYLKRDHN